LLVLLLLILMMIFNHILLLLLFLEATNLNEGQQRRIIGVLIYLLNDVVIAKHVLPRGCLCIVEVQEDDPISEGRVAK